MSGFVSPLRESKTGAPVLCNAASTSSTEAPGFADLSVAHEPATCGVAIDVPLATPKPPPGTDEVIELPGARRLRKLALFEYPAITFDFVVAPTLIAFDTHAGASIALGLLSLPDAITVAMFAVR